MFLDSYRPVLCRDVRGMGWPRRLSLWAGHLFFPPHCLACGCPLTLDENEALCLACAGKVAWVGPDRCRRCGDLVGQGLGTVESCPTCKTHPPVGIEASCACARYGDPLRGVILGLKFGRDLSGAVFLGRLLGLRIALTGLNQGLKGPWALVPVPLAKRDFAHRGFNQSEEMARVAAPLAGLPVETGLLEKTRPTPPQATLGTEARLTNLRGLFRASGKAAARFSQGGVVLVDDVMTTCATMSECARVLGEAGIRRIRAAVIARG